MHLCITSYFGIRDSLDAARNALELLGHTISDYPLMQQSRQNTTNLFQDFSDFLDRERPDGILWWCLTIDLESFIRIKEKYQLKYYYFNWDDPYNWVPNKLEHYAPYLDVAYICSVGGVQKYVDAGCRKVVYCLPGFDPKVFYSDGSLYQYDICMILTNFYADRELYPNQIFNRYQMIQQLVNGAREHGWSLALFGPEIIGQHFPEFYKGYCKYLDQNKLFNSSKINITTHVDGITDGYLNERTIDLIGAGVFFLIDDISGLERNLVPKKHCLVMDKHFLVEQIKEVLANYETPLISTIKSELAEIKNNYTWDSWAKTITSNL